MTERVSYTLIYELREVQSTNLPIDWSKEKNLTLEVWHRIQWIGIAADRNNTFYATGFYSLQATFGRSFYSDEEVVLSSVGSADVFLAKLDRLGAPLVEDGTPQAIPSPPPLPPGAPLPPSPQSPPPPALPELSEQCAIEEMATCIESSNPNHNSGKLVAGGGIVFGRHRRM